MTYKPLDDWVAEERRHGDVRTYWVGCRCESCTAANAGYAHERAMYRALLDAPAPDVRDEWAGIYRELAVLDAVYSPRDSLALRAAVELTRAELERQKA